MNEEIIIKLGADVSGLGRDLKKASGEVEGFGSKMKGAFTAIGAAAAAGAAIAGGAMLKYGTDAVNAAAEMQAVNAQFDQVFGDLGGKATQVLADMGKEFNMLPERLKAPLAQTTSMFKGLGLSTEDAMTQAATAVTMASDAAAFYDTSFENANSALNSFIKGSYEAGESIGLFASETQMAAWAAENLGLDWKNLDEAGKQVARLEFAQAMQEAAGATGQASREGEALTNVQGNLKSAWQTMLATLGEPILPMVTDWMAQLTEKIQNFDAEALIAQVKDFYERGKETIKMVKDFLEVWSPLLAGITAGIIAYKTITAGIVAYNAILKTYRTVALLATTGQLGLNAAMLANPIGLVVIAIGILVGAGVLLYKNFDKIKEKLTQLWTAFKDKFEDIKNTVKEKWGEVSAFLSNIDLKQIGKDIVLGLIKGIGSMFSDVKKKVEELANSIPEWTKKILGIASPIEKRSPKTKKRAESLLSKITKSLAEPKRRITLQEVNAF